MIEYNRINPFPFLYHFRDPQGTCFTLIKGEKFAVLVDTGYGIGNVKQLIENLISTPYIVLCTHGHMDHTAGCFQFPEVYIPKGDYDLFIEHNSKKRRLLNLEDAKEKNLIDDDFETDKYVFAPLPKVNLFEPGFKLDLGNIEIEIIDMRGHTKGSIGLLLKNEKLLLTGDAAISMIWLFLKESTSKRTYIDMLNRVKELPFDNFITGHIMRVFPKRYFDYYLEVAKEANTINSSKVSFHNFERPNTYQYSKVFENDTIGICFQEPKED